MWFEWWEYFIYWFWIDKKTNWNELNDMFGADKVTAETIMRIINEKGYSPIYYSWHFCNLRKISN
jgi:hypothetical protein